MGTIVFYSTIHTKQCQRPKKTVAFARWERRTSILFHTIAFLSLLSSLSTPLFHLFCSTAMSASFCCFIFSAISLFFQLESNLVKRACNSFVAFPTCNWAWHAHGMHYLKHSIIDHTFWIKSNVQCLRTKSDLTPYPNGDLRLFSEWDNIN